MTWKTGNADEFLEDTMDDKMIEHVHELDIGAEVSIVDETFDVYAECGCGYVLSQEEIESRLNECETLETVNAELRRGLRLLRTSFRYYKRLFAKEASRIDALLTTQERDANPS